MKLQMDRFSVFLDDNTVPPMFGVECRDGTRIYGLSTDAAEVDRLVALWNESELSPIHMRDAADDFRHI